MATAVAAVVTALAAWGGAAVALDRYGAIPPPPGPYAAIVITGAGVMPGGRPSTALFARTRLGVDLYNAGAAPILALTGGVGDWPPAESAVAQQLAVGWGVPPAAIVTEALSTSTEQNAAEIARQLGDVPILVVTDRYHALRCQRVFARHFSHVQVQGSISPPLVRIRGALREVIAVAWYTLTGRM